MSEFKGKLHETVVKFPCTDIWNDSCAQDDLDYAIERGAVGATTNPVIVKDVLKREMHSDNPKDTSQDQISRKSSLYQSLSSILHLTALVI